jgi:hypothetical protein
VTTVFPALFPSLRLSILPGRADDMRAEILLRIDGCGTDGDGGPLRVAGTLVGPRRGRDMTLPTTVKLVDLTTDHAVRDRPIQAVAPADTAPSRADAVSGRADTAFARAVFTEPAYWTPELPNLYRLQADVSRGDQTVATIDLLIGLRRLGTRGRSFWLEGRRWVPRGVAASAADFDGPLLRSLSAAAVIDDPSGQVCAAADTVGVAIIALLLDASGKALSPAQAIERIAAWSLHPAVVLAVVPRTLPADQTAATIAATRPLKGTMLIGLEVDGTQPPDLVPEAMVTAFDCLVVTLPEDGLPHEAWRSWPADTPLVVRRAVAPETAAEHRRECDQLQAALAAWGLAEGASQLPRDWAGFLSVSW